MKDKLIASVTVLNEIDETENDVYTVINSFITDVNEELRAFNCDEHEMDLITDAGPDIKDSFLIQTTDLVAFRAITDRMNRFLGELIHASTNTSFTSVRIKFTEKK
jgi:chemotaxis regulatin CheY-phosphate phosphatase CheZ